MKDVSPVKDSPAPGQRVGWNETYYNHFRVLMQRTVWGECLGIKDIQNGGTPIFARAGLYAITKLMDGSLAYVHVEDIHTIAKNHLPGPDWTPSVGLTVVLGDEEGSIVPAGTYQISALNDNGSFHVGGNVAVWPRRVTAIQG